MAQTYAWENTTLWKLLSKKRRPTAKGIKAYLETVLPGIEGILKSGGTSATDFSLHDEGHAFRVAELITTIMPQEIRQRLSSYELALLLLAAYLHDIGMTPRQDKVEAHRNFLLTGDSGVFKLSAQEQETFRRWTWEYRKTDIPLASSSATLGPATLDTAQLIMTHYCRSRHNDWSEEWIRREFTSTPRMGNYESWVDDLVLLCRSHHEGYNALLDKRFDPKLVDTPAELVHLRYLACLLRVADILEFDPERTPDVLLRHRTIAPGSLIYWLKDRYVSMKFVSHRILFYSRPPTARLHRAIEIMADEIEQELRLVEALDVATTFLKTPLGPESGYSWKLSPYLQRDVQPKDGAYVYVNGAFRPNTARVLELLSGVELYGSSMAAVREALQNAFDAVREQIARERLAKPDPSNSKWEKLYSEINSVTLSLEATEHGARLTCIDTGVGMTKEIITNKLLVSGSPVPPELLALERECERHGFQLGRTAKFGVGALSYFMLAERIEVRTRRSTVAGGESSGWVFETEGIGDFGELKGDGKSSHGSELHLYLKGDVVGDDLPGWYGKLHDYLDEELTYLPCRFELRCNLIGCQPLVREPGWRHRPSEWTARALPVSLGNSSQNLTNDYLPSRLRDKSEEEKRLHAQVLQDATSTMRWFSKSDWLPNGLGRFRVSIPYFELPGGISLGYLSVHEHDQVIVVSPIPVQTFTSVMVDALFPSGSTQMSWKGMAFTAQGQRPVNISARVEVDWHHDEAGKVLVSRNAMVMSPSAKAALRWLEKWVDDVTLEFLEEHRHSPYAALSHRWVGRGVPAKDSYLWSGGPENVWQHLQFPLTLAMEETRVSYRWAGQAVSVAQPITSVKSELKGRGLSPIAHMSWVHRRLPPNRIVKVEGDTVDLAGLWITPPTKEITPAAVGMVTSFPQSWTHVAGTRVRGYGTTLWNPQSPIVAAVDRDSVDWLQQLLEGRAFRLTDPLSYKEVLLSRRNCAATWILRLIDSSRTWGSEHRLMWNALGERNPTFLSDLWEILFDDSYLDTESAPSICFGVFNGDTALNVLSPHGWIEVPRGSADVDKLLSDPGAEWKLEKVVP